MVATARNSPITQVFTMMTVLDMFYNVNIQFTLACNNLFLLATVFSMPKTTICLCVHHDITQPLYVINMTSVKHLGDNCIQNFHLGGISSDLLLEI